MDIWPVIHDERKALATDLKGRSGEGWATDSLCSQWTVRDVLAHMTSTASLTPPAFFGKLVGSGFSFDKVQEAGVAANRGSSPADTMARFEAELTSTKHPPGPADTWLGEAIVHAEDIRRPLGIEHHYPTEAVAQSSPVRPFRSAARALRSSWITGQTSMAVLPSGRGDGNPPPLPARLVWSRPN